MVLDELVPIEHQGARWRHAFEKGEHVQMPIGRDALIEHAVGIGAQGNELGFVQRIALLGCRRGETAAGNSRAEP